MKCPYSRHFDDLEEYDYKGENDMAVKKGSAKSAKAGKSASKSMGRRRRSGDDIELTPSEEKMLDRIWDSVGKRLSKKGSTKGLSMPKGGRKK